MVNELNEVTAGIEMRQPKSTKNRLIQVDYVLRLTKYSVVCSSLVVLGAV